MMQLRFQIVAKGKESLRRGILSDLDARQPRVGLYVPERGAHRKGRNPGWLKVKGRSPGALNLEWDANAGVLHGRAVAKQGNTPATLLGEFVGYLLARPALRRRVQAINIQP